MIGPASQTRHAFAAPARLIACAQCTHFADAPRVLEAEIAGLAIMSSAYASVRAGDGLCRVHQRYVSSRSRCADFAALSFDD